MYTVKLIISHRVTLSWLFSQLHLKMIENSMFVTSTAKCHILTDCDYALESL